MNPSLTLAALALLAATSFCSGDDIKNLADKFPGPAISYVKVSADTGVSAGARKDKNFGRSGIVEVKDSDDTPESGALLQRVFLKFDLTGLKAENAKAIYLAVFGNLGDGNKPVEVEVRAIDHKDDAWNEYDVTWNKQPQAVPGNPLATIVFTFGNTPTRKTEGRWYLSQDIADSIRKLTQSGYTSANYVLTTKIREEACIFTKEHEQGNELSPRLVVIPR